MLMKEAFVMESRIPPFPDRAEGVRAHLEKHYDAGQHDEDATASYHRGSPSINKRVGAHLKKQGWQSSGYIHGEGTYYSHPKTGTTLMMQGARDNPDGNHEIQVHHNDNPGSAVHGGSFR